MTKLSSLPWSVELDEDILCAVGDEGLEVLGDGNLDGAVIRLGHGLGLEVGLEGS